MTINTPDALIKSLSIYNVLGQLVLTQNNGKNTLDISFLSSGLYLIKIETDNGVAVKKVVKE